MYEIKNRTIHKDGEPWFMVGIYYVSHKRAEQRKLLERIEEIAEAGFNTLFTPIQADSLSAKILDACAENGMAVVVEDNTSWEEIKRKHGNHPAIAFPQVVDDANRVPGIPRKEWNELSFTEKKSLVDLRIFDRIQEIQQHYPTPSNVQYLSVGASEESMQLVEDWPAMIKGYQFYNTLSDLTAIYTMSRRARELSVEPRSVLLPIVQAYQYDGERWPNIAELEAMAWLSLMSGAKGLAFYTAYDGANDMWDRMHGIEAVKTIVTRLEPYKAAILNSEELICTFDTWGIFNAIWSSEKSGTLEVTTDVVTNFPTSFASLTLPDPLSSVSNEALLKELAKRLG